ncbi:MAG: hypothetical protein V1701_03765 [Planctomycetota bacterium]
MKNHKNGQKLFNTNPYLKDERAVTKMCLRNTAASCNIEGVCCTNLVKLAQRYSEPRRKAR